MFCGLTNRRRCLVPVSSFRHYFLSNVYRASGATMDIEGAFITRLIGFGLSEKEAQLYLHLLKYGPKTPSPLANR